MGREFQPFERYYHRSIMSDFRPRLMQTKDGVIHASPAATRAISIGAFALGAAAIGAMAIGAIAIGRLRVRKAHIDELSIGSLTVGRLQVRSRE
jgi:hypothetical protein